MEKQRNFESVEFDDESIRIIYTDDYQLFDDQEIEKLEAVTYNGSYIGIWCDKDYNSKALEATQEDFDLLKKVLSQTKKFISCGSNAIFNLDSVVSFWNGDNKNVIVVDCKNSFYEVELKNLEEANTLVSALQKKWQKTIAEWNKNKDMGEKQK